MPPPLYQGSMPPLHQRSPPPLHQSSSVIFNPGPDKNALKVAARRYLPQISDPDGFTLLCVHGSGGHKEQWEPTLQQMFAKYNLGQFSIREVWAVDWQSHGEAGRINASKLANRGPVSTVEWAYAIAAFLRSEQLRGHRIVGIGQCLGSSALILATRHFLPHNIPLIGIIMVEAIMLSRDYYRHGWQERHKALDAAITLVQGLETSWPTRGAAFNYMLHNVPWKGWDRRVLSVYVNHGLHESSTGEIYSLNEPEISSYKDIPPHMDAVDQYRRIAAYVPVHFIFGGRNRFASPEAQQSIFDPKYNIQASSIQRVRHARHLVLQENPDGLAEAICIALERINQEVGASRRPRL
ncbi:Alpha/beta hydrolase family-domain-containing protein [Roridomyces roridus]|uniref:Alpha/beta hydrolase family-domain-containing protein n=1 Tax=Roridomyces roridus TaxID=1738132 RepID=A0AAD7FVW4_9AGAR|nr:Alpha/beta hydrolase family-domain-containing protein [Roridomyces roridus]